MNAATLAIAAIALLSPLHVGRDGFEQVDAVSVDSLRVPVLALRTIVITPIRLLVGREVSVRDVHVVRVDHGGFWISVPQTDDEIFVIPAEGSLIRVGAGDLVNMRGEIRQMTHPRRSARQAAWHDQLYIFAYVVRPTGIADSGAARRSADSVTADQSD